MKNKNSLTIVIPAYNEEPTLRAVVAKVGRLAARYASDYEVIVVDDASTDRTGAILDELAVENVHIRAIHNPKNMNFGWNFRKGLELARMQYVSFIPGDDDISEDSLERMIGAIGKTDFVLLYHSNYEARHWLRRIVSKLFVRMMNFLFGLTVRYYNGPAMFRTEVLRAVPMSTFSFAFVAEIVVTLIKRGYSYMEVPMTLRPERKGVNLRVFRPRNTWGVIKTVARLWWHVRIRHRA